MCVRDLILNRKSNVKISLVEFLFLKSSLEEFELVSKLVTVSLWVEQLFSTLLVKGLIPIVVIVVFLSLGKTCNGALLPFVKET